MTATSSPDFPLALTDAAAAQLSEALAELRAPMLRVSVRGGGCAGFGYGFEPEHELQEDDLVKDYGAFKVVTDPFSAGLLTGGTLDWQEGTLSSQFVVHNPNAVTTCGCGSSFAVRG